MTQGEIPPDSSETRAPGWSRRRVLSVTAAAVGALGVGAVAFPFIESRERGAHEGTSVSIDIAKLKPKHMVVASWRGRPVYVLRRTELELARLPTLNGRVKDPHSKAAQQPANLPGWNPIQRSVVPEYLVVVGICTHLGCIPELYASVGDPRLGPSWPGGYWCPCHGSQYDLAGRVMNGSPAPLNLPVPPYYFKNATTIVAGELADGSERNWEPQRW